MRRFDSSSEGEADSAGIAKSPPTETSSIRVLTDTVVKSPAAVSSVINLEGIHRVPSPRIREAALNVLLVSSTGCCAFNEIASIVSKCNPDTAPQ